MPGLHADIADTIGDHVFRNQSYTPPTTVYAGYSASTGTESTDANYARQAITLSAFSSGASANSAIVEFPAVAASDSVVEGALFDAASGGNQMTPWKAVTGGTKSVSAGEQPRIPIGDYDVDLSP